MESLENSQLYFEIYQYLGYKFLISSINNPNNYKDLPYPSKVEVGLAYRLTNLGLSFLINFRENLLIISESQPSHLKCRD